MKGATIYLPTLILSFLLSNGGLVKPTVHLNLFFRLELSAYSLGKTSLSSVAKIVIKLFASN